MTDAIGWFATSILLLTIGRQVFTQWRDKTSIGVSKWLFIGQSVASISFVIYSLLLHNWVFVVTNAAMLGLAVAGQIIFLRNKKDSSAASL